MESQSSDHFVQPRPETRLLHELRLALQELDRTDSDTQEISVHTANRVLLLEWELAYSRVGDLVDGGVTCDPTNQFGLYFRDAELLKVISKLVDASRSANRHLIGNEVFRAIDDFKAAANDILSNMIEGAAGLVDRATAVVLLCCGSDFAGAFGHALADIVQLDQDAGDRRSDLRPSPTELEKVLRGAADYRTVFRRISRDVFGTNARFVYSRIQARLTDLVCEMLERLEASSGWIYIHDVADEWVAPAWHNPGNPKERDYSDRTHPMLEPEGRKVRLVRLPHATPGERMGIIRHVIKTRRPYLSNDVSNDEHYRVADDETRSEMAIPVFYNDPVSSSSELVAVLNIEARHFDAFSPGQLWESQTNVLDLLPDILTFQALLRENGDEPIAWHPRYHGWDLSRLLGRLCDNISEALARHIESDSLLRIQAPAVTIWWADWQSAVSANSGHIGAPPPVLWARGTSRFDYQHLVEPLVRENIFGFIATGADLPRGCINSDYWESIPQFLRRDKADAMGLDRVSVTSLRIESPNDNDRWGALSVYSFFDDPHPSASMIRQIASLLEGQIKQYEASLEPIVTAWVQRAISTNRRIDPQETLAELLKIALELTDSLAGSIFVLDPDYCSSDGSPPGKIPTRFVCAATTGLEDNTGERITNPVFHGANTSQYKAEYQIGFATVASKPRQTEWLAANPGKTLRRNRRPEEDGFDSIYDFRQQRGCSETLDAVDTDHRRFLAISVEQPNRDRHLALAVIRVVRTAQQRPFLQSDERLLAAIGRVARDAVNEWRESLRAIQPSREAEMAPKKWVLLDLISQEASPNRRSFVAKQTLLRPISNPELYSRPVIDEVLKSVLRCFDGWRALHCSLREVVVDRKRHQCDSSKKKLRLVEFHSVVTPYFPDQDESPPDRWKPSDRIATIARLSHETNKVVTFCFSSDHDELRTDLFKNISPDSQHVKAGIVIPFSTVTPGGVASWVLCIDFVNKIDRNQWCEAKESFRCALLAAAKLAAILTARTPSASQSNENQANESGLKRLLVRGMNSFDASWALLDVVTAYGSNEKIPFQYRYDNRFDLSALSFDWQADKLHRFGIEGYANGEVILRVKLPFGPVNAGYFNCGMKASNAAELFALRDETGWLRSVSELKEGWARLLVDSWLSTTYNWELTQDPCAMEPINGKRYEGLTRWEIQSSFSAKRSSEPVIVSSKEFSELSKTD